MISVSWSDVHLELEALASWAPPDFPGSMYRGALASALRRLVCVMHRPSCEGCPLVQACIYHRLFETRPDPAAGVMRRYNHAPHPLVIVVTWRDQKGAIRPPGTREALTVRLFGPDAATAPFLVEAAGSMAAHGLGRGRVPFRVVTARIEPGCGARPSRDGQASASQPALPRLPWRRRWHLRSPLRIASQGKPIGPDRLDGAVIGRSVLRRIGLMAQFYGILDPAIDFPALAAQATRLRLCEADIRWLSLRRWSSRQRAEQSIGGILGSLVLDFAEAPDLAVLADWVPVMHLGKDTSMGLGHVEAEAA